MINNQVDNAIDYLFEEMMNPTNYHDVSFRKLGDSAKRLGIIYDLMHFNACNIAT